jgi:hypothetical protein
MKITQHVAKACACVYYSMVRNCKILSYGL